jgi:RNA polymerase sigma-70 factor (ECF subfamily)
MAPDNLEELPTLGEQDEASLTLLYETYGGKIYNLAYRMTGSREDAEDITQETFLQVYRHMSDYREESRVYTWIYAIARNLCYRFFKRQKHASLVSFEALILSSSGIEMPAEITDLEKQHLIGQVKDGCLTGLLRCLSFNQRLAFILHTLMGLPLRDVSEILGKSEGAAKVLAHRARLNIKTFLCKNCSLYDPANSCRCDKLLGFSLKQGWITRFPDAGSSTMVDTRQIEEEIKEIRTVVDLYTSLDTPNPSKSLNRQIRTLIGSRSWAILDDKKA